MGKGPACCVPRVGAASALHRVGACTAHREYRHPPPRGAASLSPQRAQRRAARLVPLFRCIALSRSMAVYIRVGRHRAPTLIGHCSRSPTASTRSTRKRAKAHTCRIGTQSSHACSRPARRRASCGAQPNQPFCRSGAPSAALRTRIGAERNRVWDSACSTFVCRGMLVLPAGLAGRIIIHRDAHQRVPRRQLVRGDAQLAQICGPRQGNQDQGTTIPSPCSSHFVVR